MRHLARIFSRFVPTGTRVPIVRGPLRGAKWFAGAAAGRGKGLSPCLNLCEPGQLGIADKVSRGLNVCFDIGANVGLYSLLFARNAGRVLSFEPMPRNLAWLQRLIEANRLSNVTVVPMAVSDRVQLAAFQEGDNCAVGSLSDSGFPVACVPVDEIVSRFGLVPDLLKIDVEGAEVSVLRGASRVLAQRKPLILLSTHSVALKAACMDFVRSLGYENINPLDADSVERAAELFLS